MGLDVSFDPEQQIILTSPRKTNVTLTEAVWTQYHEQKLLKSPGKLVFFSTISFRNGKTIFSCHDGGILCR